MVRGCRDDAQERFLYHARRSVAISRMAGSERQLPDGVARRAPLAWAEGERMRRLKSVLLGYRIAVRLPTSLTVWLVNRTWPWGRPVLDYLEFHLADHCNLNCAGCTHFAPFADTKFADIGNLRRDLMRLKVLFRNIRHLRIMGGEPLLHPDVAECVRLVREMFPRSNIRLVTNGLKLLDRSDVVVDAVLAVLKENNVGVDWTLYPPLEKRREEIVRRCKEAGVDLRISENGAFMARLLPDGGATSKDSFRWCRLCAYCPLLDDGRIYLCAQAHYVAYYNRVAGTSVPLDCGLDIHAATAREILAYLMRPSRTCAWCDAGARHFKWKGDARPEDWLR